MDENLVDLWGFRLVERLDESWAVYLVCYWAAHLDENLVVLWGFRLVEHLDESWVEC